MGVREEREVEGCVFECERMGAAGQEGGRYLWDICGKLMENEVTYTF